MAGRRASSALEEQAELDALRGRADRAAAAAGQTLAELTGRLAQARRPAALARRQAADARDRARRALSAGTRPAVSRRGAWRAGLTAASVTALIAVVVLARRRLRP